jgi:hypothetical protein
VAILLTAIVAGAYFLMMAIEPTEINTSDFNPVSVRLIPVSVSSHHENADKIIQLPASKTVLFLVMYFNVVPFMGKPDRTYIYQRWKFCEMLESDGIWNCH